MLIMGIEATVRSERTRWDSLLDAVNSCAWLCKTKNWDTECMLPFPCFIFGERYPISVKSELRESHSAGYRLITAPSHLASPLPQTAGYTKVALSKSFTIVAFGVVYIPSSFPSPAISLMSQLTMFPKTTLPATFRCV